MCLRCICVYLLNFVLHNLYFYLYQSYIGAIFAFLVVASVLSG
jgi:hypothetical protein